MSRSTRCTAKRKDGKRCRARAVSGSKRCAAHATGKAVRQCTARTRAGARCRRPAVRGGKVCRLHGGAAPQVQRAALEREITSPGALEAETERILEGGFDELEELRRLLALCFAAVNRVQGEMTSEPCDACGRSGDVQLLGAWLSSLEKWAQRAESISVNLRKLSTDARFKQLAEDLVGWFVEWMVRYIPEHRQDAAVRELERTLDEINERSQTR